MAYATLQDAQLMYGPAQIATVCDRDLDGLVDGASFQMHLNMAAAQMDAYLLGRYPLPLLPEQIPEYFKQANVDIAIANATPTADVGTTEIGRRRDSALALMRMIARNEIKLGQSTTQPNISATPQSVVTQRDECLPTVFSDGARVYTDQNLKRLL